MTTAKRNALVAGATFAVAACCGVVCLAYWLTYDPAATLQFRVPGGDGTPPDAHLHDKPVDLAGTFQQFDGQPADLPGAWPRFRGPNGDNIVPDGPPLAEAWGADDPRVLWGIDLGEGHAGAAILNGRVYIIDYDEQSKQDAIRCFSLGDGREIWRRSYRVSVKRNHGMSRTVPAVTGKYLVTMGPRCHVVCLDSTSGAFRWGIDLQREYGTKEPLWYTGQCPLIVDGRVLLAPCGKDVLMMAVDCETGQPVWKAPNPKGWDMSHSSIVPMTIAGKAMYVYAAVGGVAGVSTDGAILWQLPWKAKVVAPSPVPLEDGKIFVTAGYGEGGMTLQVREANGTFNAEVLEQHGPKDGLACEQQTPIVYDGLLYAIMPKDAGALRCQFVCYRPDGSLVWSSGQANRFGLGPFLLADGKFYILNDEGALTMIKASKDAYVSLAQAQVLHGQDAWAPIAVADGRMVLRDSKRMVCIAVGAAS